MPASSIMNASQPKIGSMRRRVPLGIEKPPKQEVVVEVLAKLPITADGEQSDQQLLPCQARFRIGFRLVSLVAAPTAFEVSDGSDASVGFAPPRTPPSVTYAGATVLLSWVVIYPIRGFSAAC